MEEAFVVGRASVETARTHTHLASATDMETEASSMLNENILLRFALSSSRCATCRIRVIWSFDLFVLAFLSRACCLFKRTFCSLFVCGPLNN